MCVSVIQINTHTPVGPDRIPIRYETTGSDLRDHTGVFDSVNRSVRYTQMFKFTAVCVFGEACVCVSAPAGGQRSPPDIISL